MRSDEIRPGDLVAGKYRVRAILSRSRGMLVEAFHTEFDQRVVIRILSPAMCDAKEIERFRREARTLAKLESEHVARIFDVGTEGDGTFYFVRQYLEGQDLAAYLKKRGRLPLPEAVLYVLQAAEAMAETHSHQIILREMQPQHLFLTQRLGVSLVKVVDFGTAKLLRDAAAPGAGGELTATTMFGLSPYSSPELVRKAKNVDVRTDIWSLGAILYELLAGKPPFQGEMAALMLAITKDEPVPLTQLRPDLPREMDQVIGWCLAKDVDRRFGSVHAFAHALVPYAPPEGQVLVTRIGAMASAAKERRPASVPPAPPIATSGGAGARPQAPAKQAPPPPAAGKPAPRPAAGRPAQPLDEADSVTSLHAVDLVDDDEDERIATKVMSSPADAMQAMKKPGAGRQPPAAGQRPPAQPPVPQSNPSAQQAPAQPPAGGGGGEATFERTVFMGNDFVPTSPGPIKPQAPAGRPASGQPMFAGAAHGLEIPKGPGAPQQPPPPQNARPSSQPGLAPAPGMPGGPQGPAGPAGGQGGSLLGPSLNLDAPRPTWGSSPSDPQSQGQRQATPMSSVVPAGPPSFGPPPPPSSAIGTGPHAAMDGPRNAGARKAAIAAIAAACVLLPALALIFIFGGRGGDSGSAATPGTGAVTVPLPTTPPPATVAPPADTPAAATATADVAPTQAPSAAGSPPRRWRVDPARARPPPPRARAARPRSRRRRRPSPRPRRPPLRRRRRRRRPPRRPGVTWARSWRWPSVEAAPSRSTAPRRAAAPPSRCP